MASFDGLYIGLSALRAHQTMQDTIGHNVANVNTPGYSRQDVALETLPPLRGASMSPAGSGVIAADIRRSASTLLNQQIAQEGSVLGQWEVLRDGTSEVTKLFHEPGDSGLQGMLDNFWQSWRDLASNPSSTANRASVLDAGDRLATGIETVATGLTNFSVRMSDQFSQKIDRVNSLASEMLIINHEVMQALANGNVANDLLDRRDVVLDELNRLAQIKSAQNADGSTSIMLDGRFLVDANNATMLQMAKTPSGEAQAVWADTHQALATGTGELGAVSELQTWANDDVMKRLDTLASQIIVAVNGQHAQGVDSAGADGGAFFDGTTAATITLSRNVEGHPERLAAGTGPGPKVVPGDGSNALAIGNLAQAKLKDVNDSIDNMYAVLVGQVGLAAEKSSQMASHQDELVTFLNGRKQEIAGVSLDDEAVRMMSAQRAYQAAARVITTVDQMLDKLINDTGMVGR